MNWTDLWVQTMFASVISDLSRSIEITIQDIISGVSEFTRASDAAVFHSGHHYLFHDEEKRTEV